MTIELISTPTGTVYCAVYGKDCTGPHSFYTLALLDGLARGWPTGATL